MKNKYNNIFILNIILFILIILIILYIKLYKNDTFNNLEKKKISKTTTQSYPIDKTKLYGSLFLENLDKNIKKLSNPDIKYEGTRSELNNYIDILH